MDSGFCWTLFGVSDNAQIPPFSWSMPVTEGVLDREFLLGVIKIPPGERNTKPAEDFRFLGVIMSGSVSKWVLPLDDRRLRFEGDFSTSPTSSGIASLWRPKKSNGEERYATWAESSPSGIGMNLSFWMIEIGRAHV